MNDDQDGVSEAEKEKVVVEAAAAMSKATPKPPPVFFPIDIEKLRKRVFDFYPRSGKPFRSVLPDVRYSEVVGRRR